MIIMGIYLNDIHIYIYSETSMSHPSSQKKEVQGFTLDPLTLDLYIYIYKPLEAKGMVVVDHQAPGTNVTLKVESLDVLDAKARILDAGKSGFPDAKHGKWLEDVVFFLGGVGWGTSGDDVYMEMIMEMFVYLKSIHLWSWIAPPIFVLKRIFVE